MSFPNYRSAFFEATDTSFYKAMRHKVDGSVQEISGVNGTELGLNKSADLGLTATVSATTPGGPGGVS